MVKTLCEMKSDLIDELAKRASLVASVSKQISDLTLADGKVPSAQKFQQLESLRVELHSFMQEWEYVNLKLQEHKSSHGC